MNILFLTTHFNTGGITSYILTLSKQLICSGHQVFVVSSGGDMVDEFEEFGGHHLTCLIQTKSILSFKLVAALPKVKRFIVRHNIEIMHAHTRVTQFLACLLSILTRVPYMTTCHGFFRPRWIRRMMPCWGRKVVAISPQVAGHLERDFSVDPKDIFIVRNGICLDTFTSLNNENKEERLEGHGLSGKKIIGIIARLSDVKGHRILINAMMMIRDQVPNAHLIIVGEGKEELRLKQQVERLHLSDAVSFYPVINRTIEFLSLFDCFVLPSLQEGLGLSVMEAQSAGLPVIASAVGGIPTLIEHEQTGLLVDSQDEIRLAEAVVHVLKDPAFAANLGRRAQEKAAQDYGSEEMAAKIVKIYEEVLENA